MADGLVVWWVSWSVSVWGGWLVGFNGLVGGSVGQVVCGWFGQCTGGWVCGLYGHLLGGWLVHGWMVDSVSECVVGVNGWVGGSQGQSVCG